MIKIEDYEVLGWEAAIRGMRNPMNSWSKSDSMVPSQRNGGIDYLKIGENDLDLMKRLCKAGTDHRKFMRMITVYVDITAPFYWYKEFDTYKVGTVANSCSTMHKIAEKEFTLADFSREHLNTSDCPCYKYTDSLDYENDIMDVPALQVLKITIQALNYYRKLYLETKDKRYWWQMIQLLPTSYNQKRTVMLNYEVLANMYHSRKNHKLDEWRRFCEFIEELPYSELITD